MAADYLSPFPPRAGLKDSLQHLVCRCADVVMEQTAGARGYRASFARAWPEIEVMLLSAGEIASSLLAGDIHLGITGEDLLREEPLPNWPAACT